MTRFLFDTNVFVYALGREHPYREACRTLLARQGNGELEGAIAVDLLQEFCHQRRRQGRDRAQAAEDARDIADVTTVLDVRQADLRLALDLYARHERLDALDAVFAAVALQHGLSCVVSADAAFDELAQLQRVDPLDTDAVNALAG